MELVAPEKSLILHGTHVRQRYSWDCGIACVLMVVSDEHRNIFESHYDAICKDEEIHSSTWTIDLCYMLKRFEVKHCMYTKKIGVSIQSSSGIRITEKDVQRVRKRLKEASSAGLQVVETSLPTEALVEHVESRGAAIVLVDGRLLGCDWCQRNKLAAELRSVWSGGYRGHYITVVGRAGARLVYRDPAASARACAVRAKRLHAARRAPGTDQDVILVNVDHNYK